ncbi:metallophosphoesterase family protein [Pseudogemmobacter sonorensis]|uniref:metallophosphoesterase family protein n=1 Tax=Pseudogemmobacter sonorensis TaxID=2989681 RepID=UPI0036975912
MRIAILTDIHGNRPAFEAVLADLAARGAERIVLLGDYVGYGPDPEWCCERVMALVAGGATALRGNHDDAAAGRPQSMSALARAAMDWTRPRLSAAQKAFLGALPLQAREGEALFTHASANAPSDWIYVTSETTAAGSFRACDARLIFCGHVHVPLLVSRDRGGVVRPQGFRIGAALPMIRSRRWLAVAGSVGQPRDGTPEAGYLMLDTEPGGGTAAPGAGTVAGGGAVAELTFLRVPYDAAGVAARSRALGLPEELALRLVRGR